MIEMDSKFWDEIVNRIKAGESQTDLANTLGMTKNQFRYRLNKYLKQQQNVLEKTADLTGQAYWEVMLDHSLCDETWTRKWQVNRLVLLVKEPTTIHAYWEVNDLRKRLISEHFGCDWNHLPFYLQMHDVTQLHFTGYNAHSTRRIQVGPQMENYYIHDAQPGRRYQVDFGTHTIQGDYFTILRSNIVETPQVRSDSHLNPCIQFGTLHKSGFDKEFEKSMMDPADPAPFIRESWQGQFDGYTLVQSQGGEK